MTPVEKDELRERLVRSLDGAWSARMLSPVEKIALAEELADRLCEGPGWMTRQILAAKAALSRMNPPGDCI